MPGRPASRGLRTAEVLHSPIAMFHREDRIVLFSGADEPMDRKQAVVNTLLSPSVPFITIDTDTTREAGLPLQLPEERWARTPVLAFLAQLACAELAERMQLDVDAPVDLKKVTVTR
jgi:fructoselysine-6-P-deglycase FrlB-like protein